MVNKKRGKKMRRRRGTKGGNITRENKGDSGGMKYRVSSLHNRRTLCSAHAECI